MRDWPRVFPGDNYSGFYTLNDNTMSDMIVTMLDAWDIYGDKRYLDAAIRGGEFFLRAQLPEPQPGWAQQYDQQMHPAWARKFEPPAVSGGESQGVMNTLILLYRRTAGSSQERGESSSIHCPMHLPIFVARCWMTAALPDSTSSKPIVRCFSPSNTN